VSGPVGLAAAIRFLRQVGQPAIWEHEQTLTRHTLARLRAVPGLRLLGQGDPPDRISVFSFTLEGLPALEIARAADRQGIALRAGDLASAYLYSTKEDIDQLGDVLDRLARA
jgi:cysteine desulfurase/selenocysteine lyase